jgi:FAD/FMN-containing dehydrogenase
MSRSDEWYDLPRAAAGIRLFRTRDELREHNLHDTEEPPLEHSTTPPGGEAYTVRTSDGTYNDLTCPRMGSAGMRFGRNVPLSETFPDTGNLLNPNPRQVSLELLTRTVFQPATILNVIAAAWIQFMVHDWFVHKKGSWTHTHDIPLDESDNWHERTMRVPKTPADPPKVPGSQRPPAFINENTHWWDGSQVYGSSLSAQTSLRAGRDGKVLVSPSGRLGVDPVTGLEITGFTENGWVGVSLLHGLFALEHNAICDELKRHNPRWDDERLFQQARLVNAALLAKIHTTEWSTAILPREVLSTGLKTAWHGRFSKLQNIFPGLGDNDVFSGIPGSPTDHHGVTFSLTEEFVSVYRMHTLMPDHFTIRSAATDVGLVNADLPELLGLRGVDFLARFNPEDLFYSFGIHNPGAVRLHNYPKFLQHLVKDNGDQFDLGTVDILRDRERGVPRYNRLRRLLHKAPVRSFEELTDNPEWAAEIKRVYNNDLEMVDTMVGLMAEPLPEGMGFSDTAFRVFLLMASRRLKSDRFLSKDYRPEIYTKQGIDWVEENSMKSVITRHFPAVAFALEGLDDDNAFKPWKVKTGDRTSRPAQVTTPITNYDGAIVTTPREHVRPQTVEELQAILRQPTRYPSPVRAMGSYHSLTPCASSTGTIVNMNGLNRILKIDPATMTMTAQAGVQLVDAAAALREQNLQFMLNIEIGNLTLGSAACCHTKDSLDGVEFGQVNSYVTSIKWVSPSGTLEEASETKNPELLPFVRASYGLAGIVYEVTFRIKPLEIITFNYDVHEIADLTDDILAQAIASNQSIVMWTVGDNIVIQSRNRGTELKHEWLADARRFGWSFIAAFSGRGLRDRLGGTPLGNFKERLGIGLELGFYRLLSAGGGFTLHSPDKIINYKNTPPEARYAFSFWAFPRADFVKNLKAYVKWAEDHHKATGFRCNMPLGSYFIRKDTSSLLSYTWDGDIISIDPIHAVGAKEHDAWATFLKAFNVWASERGGIPLLNQSPFVQREHVVAAYGDRWKKLADWLHEVDPNRRMVNEFFDGLLP